MQSVMTSSCLLRKTCWVVSCPSGPLEVKWRIDLLHWGHVFSTSVTHRLMQLMQYVCVQQSSFVSLASVITSNHIVQVVCCSASLISFISSWLKCTERLKVAVSYNLHLLYRELCFEQLGSLEDSDSSPVFILSALVSSAGSCWLVATTPGFKILL